MIVVHCPAVIFIKLNLYMVMIIAVFIQFPAIFFIVFNNYMKGVRSFYMFVADSTRHMIVKFVRFQAHVDIVIDIMRVIMFVLSFADNFSNI